MNQQRYYHDILDNFSTNTNYNNLKITTGSSTHSVPTAVVASILGAGATAAQATPPTTNTVAANAAAESNRLSSVANNSNTNNENRYNSPYECYILVNILNGPKKMLSF